MRFGKKIALAVAGTGLVTALVAGASFALFSAQGDNQSNTFATGTVNLTDDVSNACAVTNMAPGDPPSTCTYKVTYTGSLPAWIGLDTALTSTAPDLAVTVTDANGQTFNNNQADQVVGAAAVSTNWSDTFTVSASLPSTAGNADQGQNASEKLTVHAVQSANNTNGGNTGPNAWS